MRTGISLFFSLGKWDLGHCQTENYRKENNQKWELDYDVGVNILGNEILAKFSHPPSSSGSFLRDVPLCQAHFVHTRGCVAAI